MASLLKTAENLKIKGLAEVTSSSSKGEGGNPGDSNRNSPASGNGNANGDHNGISTASLIPTTPSKGQLISKGPFGVLKSTEVFFVRISALSSKERSNKKSSAR